MVMWLVMFCGNVSFIRGGRLGFGLTLSFGAYIGSCVRRKGCVPLSLLRPL